MAFVPSLFIDVGATGTFFTLRETYLHTNYIRGGGDFGGAVVNGVYQGTTTTEVRSFHHKNLSQDPDEALEKATEASLKMGIPLKTTRESLTEELRDIKRSTKEEMERRARELQELRELHEAERNAQREELLANDMMPIGSYVGTPFVKIKPSYLTWLATTDLDNVWLQKAAEVVREKYSDLLLPLPNKDSFYGNVGEKIEVPVTVVYVGGYTRNAFNGYGSEYVYITTMVTENGDCLVVKSPTFTGKIGEKFVLKGKVKDQTYYKGQAQTVVFYAKKG